MTLGAIRINAGRTQEGEEDWRQALAIYEKQAPRNYGAMAEVKLALSQFLAKQNRLQEAEALALSARDETAQSLGPEAPVAKATAANWARIHALAGH